MKKLSMVFFCAWVMLVLPITVHAHPGKTDGSGGHTDRSTGGYHYHHGYGAHDHYDMDGDGVIDCPYDFDDQTNHNSGSSGNSSSGNYIYEQPSTQSTVPKIELTASPVVEIETEEEVKPVPTWVYWTFIIMAIIIVGMGCSIHHKNAEIEKIRDLHYNELDEIKKNHEKELQTTQEKIEANLSLKSAADKDLAAAEDRLARINGEYQATASALALGRAELEKVKKQRNLYTGAPDDITFRKEGIPIYWKPNKDRPYGDLTVFVSLRSNVYHADRFCASYASRTMHLFDVMDRLRPCRKCALNAFDFKSVPNWYDPR